MDSLVRLRKDICDCRACPRLVAWRERVAAREAGRVPRRDVLGPSGARVRRSEGADRGAGPGAGGARGEPHRPVLHRRPIGRLAVPGDAPRRPGQPARVGVGRRRIGAHRRVDLGSGAVRPTRQHAAARRARQLPGLPAARVGAVAPGPGGGVPGRVRLPGGVQRVRCASSPEVRSRGRRPRRRTG